MDLPMPRTFARPPLAHCFPAMTSWMADQKRGFQFLAVEAPAPFAARVKLNRPEKRKGFNMGLWHEIGESSKQSKSRASCGRFA